MADKRNLIWIDLEMSGLEVETCTILEIASIVTTSELEVVAHGPDLVIHQEDAVLDAMDSWNTDHHGRSGLTQAVKDSKISIEEAEEKTLAFLREHCAARTSPLCGNSVSNDRNFIDKYMPRLAEFLHYRIIDVSSLKELVNRWYGDAVTFKKKDAHRALPDIEESIAELRYYREEFFRPREK